MLHHSRIRGTMDKRVEVEDMGVAMEVDTEVVIMEVVIMAEEEIEAEIEEGITVEEVVDMEEEEVGVEAWQNSRARNNLIDYLLCSISKFKLK